MSSISFSNCSHKHISSLQYLSSSRPDPAHTCVGVFFPSRLTNESNVSAAIGAGYVGTEKKRTSLPCLALLQGELFLLHLAHIILARFFCGGALASTVILSLHCLVGINSLVVELKAECVFWFDSQ